MVDGTRLKPDELSELFRLLSSDKRRGVLRVLRQREMTASEIADLVGASMANIARDYLEPLTRLGLIEAHTDPNDLRRRPYRLTSLGSQVDEMVRVLEEAGPLAPPAGTQQFYAPHQAGAGSTQPPPAPGRPPLPYLLLYNSGYIAAWGLFLLSVRGLAVGMWGPWVPLTWFFISTLLSVLWYRVERGFLRRTFPPPREPRG